MKRLAYIGLAAILALQPVAAAWAMCACGVGPESVEMPTSHDHAGHGAMDHGHTGHGGPADHPGDAKDCCDTSCENPVCQAGCQALGSVMLYLEVAPSELSCVSSSVLVSEVSAPLVPGFDIPLLRPPIIS
ncbi:MAG: hypothetical protein QNJ40_03535 [Xanthomonadales bacterium]|nr:hypothetical protein [Xanthomonadales bacterium]